MEPSQAEHEQISTALEVEKLDEGLFRSKSLWLPAYGRGVFGGQVISQALVSATNCVDPAYGLHSLHCYFLLSASPDVPIIYQVERVRKGRSYSSCAVKAVQKGRIVFVLLCSFQIPEPWHPSHQWAMPQGIPDPDKCELEEVVCAQLAQQEDRTNPAIANVYRRFASERARSPIAVKLAKKLAASESKPEVHMYWMQARDIPKYEPPFQKCILGYLSDLYFIYSGAQISGLKRFGTGDHSLGMTSTLDHSIYYYDDNFDCADWLLYVITSPRARYGRGVVHGRIYSRDGRLVAITTQEGVIRSRKRAPDDTAAAVPAKL